MSLVCQSMCILEEHSQQMLFRSDLKRRSIGLFEDVHAVCSVVRVCDETWYWCQLMKRGFQRVFPDAVTAS